jgi:hypothetical protein
MLVPMAPAAWAVAPGGGDVDGREGATVLRLTVAPVLEPARVLPPGR